MEAAAGGYKRVKKLLGRGQTEIQFNRLLTYPIPVLTNGYM